MRNEDLKSVDPKRIRPKDFTIDVDHLPLVTGEIHFIREVDSRGKISVLNEYFNVGKAYTGEYVWASIETMKQKLMICYKDETPIRIILGLPLVLLSYSCLYIV